MQKVALIASLAALGASGWLVYSQGCLPCEVRSLRAEVETLSALEARIAALEDRAKGTPGAPRAVAGPAGEAAAEGGARSDASTEPPPLAAAPSRSSTGAAPAPETVDALEKRLAALEERSKAQDAAGAQIVRRAPTLTLPNGGRLYASVDDAKDDLALTDPQKADFDRIVADARRQLDEIRRIPDDEGKTLEGVTKEMFQPSADGSLRLDLGKATAFRAKRIPGRNETYGQAEQRVRAEAKRQMRDDLSSEQQAKFDKSNPDPMLGGGAGFGAVSFAVSADSFVTAGMDGK